MLRPICLALATLGIALGLTLAAAPELRAGTLLDRLQEAAHRAEGGNTLRVSLDQAVAMVRRESAGKVIGARTRTAGGRTVHYVKVLDASGRVRVYRVDAHTGRMSR